jgi:hypothetical protein
VVGGSAAGVPHLRPDPSAVQATCTSIVLSMALSISPSMPDRCGPALAADHPAQSTHRPRGDQACHRTVSSMVVETWHPKAITEGADNPGNDLVEDRTNGQRQGSGLWRKGVRIPPNEEGTSNFPGEVSRQGSVSPGTPDRAGNTLPTRCGHREGPPSKEECHAGPCGRRRGAGRLLWWQAG